jgi:hypothetical protein
VHLFVADRENGGILSMIGAAKEAAREVRGTR